MMKTMLKYETVVVGSLETNCYLVYDDQSLECAVVDPGAEPHRIIRAVLELKLEPVILVNTHGHIDHIGANKDIKEKFEIPFWIHDSDKAMLNNILQSELGLFLGARESPPPDGFLKDGKELTIGTGILKILHTPGHSPGSVSLLGDGFVLSGDSLFYGGVGRTDLPGGSWEELVHSINSKILILPEETVVLPGHGPMTTVGLEKSTNPFIT